jgi:hypothetical protein
MSPKCRLTTLSGLDMELCQVKDFGRLSRWNALKLYQTCRLGNSYMKDLINLLRLTAMLPETSIYLNLGPDLVKHILSLSLCGESAERPAFFYTGKSGWENAYIKSK